MTVVHEPDEHHCSPGWTRYEITGSSIPELNGRTGLRPPDLGIKDGTVIECECGRTWVAYHQNGRTFIDLSPKFRPEGRLERWRRERKTKR